MEEEIINLKLNELRKHLITNPTNRQIVESLGSETEDRISSYLEVVPDDILMRQNIGFIELAYFEDYNSAFIIFNEIYEKFKDIKSLIWLLYIEEEFMGGIRVETCNKIGNSISNDNKLLGCLSLFEGLYLLKNNLGRNTQDKIETSIRLYPNLVRGIVELGKMQKAEGKSTAASILFKNGADIIKRGIYHHNVYNAELYFYEQISWEFYSQDKFEYILKLIKSLEYI